jgi:hypothetical protein
MRKKTSDEIFYRIKSEGLLSKLKWSVYEVIYKHGPITANEVWKFHLSHLQQRSVTPRTSELEELGVICEIIRRDCQVTGNNCVAWETTDNLPKNLKRELTYLEELKNTLRKQEASVAKTKKAIDKITGKQHNKNQMGLFEGKIQ